MQRGGEQGGTPGQHTEALLPLHHKHVRSTGLGLTHARRSTHLPRQPPLTTRVPCRGCRLYAPHCGQQPRMHVYKAWHLLKCAAGVSLVRECASTRHTSRRGDTWRAFVAMAAAGRGVGG
jgi:hypothetical protein